MVQDGDDSSDTSVLDKLDILVSQHWTIATDTTEFFCNLSTFNIFYRPIITGAQISEFEAEQRYHKPQKYENEFWYDGTLGCDLLHRRVQWRGMVCNWKLWSEPDDANDAAQIVLTTPEGEYHYLIAPETFCHKLEQRKRWLHGDDEDVEEAEVEQEAELER